MSADFPTIFLTQVEFKFKLAWKLRHAGLSSWRAKNTTSTSSATIYYGRYIQTGTNVKEDWEEGEKAFTYDFRSAGPYSVL